MEYNISKKLTALRETLFEGCQEQPVDLDFNLPDYCPDVQKILKCQVCPRITSRNISADRLDVDGVAIVKLLYIDAVKMCVRCCEHSLPFSNSFNLKSSPQDAVVFTKTKIDYVNCRALSPRRFDVHGAFSICAKVVGKENHEIVTGVEQSDIEEKKKTIIVGNVTGIGQEQFSIEEVMELNPGKPEIESIVRTDVSVSVNDYKTVANKLVVKGEATVRVLYVSDLDQGSLETIEYSIPVSQIVDVDGIDDDCVCDVSLEVLNYDIKTQADGSGEDNLLALELKLVATAIACANSEVSILTDAYSRTYDTDLEYKQITIPKLAECIDEVCISKETLEIESKNVSQVIDIWSDIASINAKLEDENIVFTGKFNACILAYNGDNQTFYVERMIDFTHSIPWTDKSQSIDCKPNICILSMSYRITGSGDLEIRTEIKINAPVYEMNVHKFINGIYINEDKLRKKDSGAALTIYYADQGEDLWDIAREYCTSVDAIKSENELDSEILKDRKMLLIPMS